MFRNYPRLIIAGTHSGVGKTTVSLALMAALTAQGRRVQPFKIGPDFLDPMHHNAVTGRHSYNLDGWMLDASANKYAFEQAAREADLSIIEGMMGLFDGASAVDDSGSTAQMAKHLSAPVLLVVDGSAMARSVAAMVCGYATFDPDIRVVGVVFNRVNSKGHFVLLRDSVENSCSVKVVGYLKSDPVVTIEDRHLGLRVAFEQMGTDVYDKLGESAIETIDLALVEDLAASHNVPSSPPVKILQEIPKTIGGPNKTVKIGIAYDSAFCFYYQENFSAMRDQGAELIFFSPLVDVEMPKVDLLYLGGGYPELHEKGLSENIRMRQAIKDFACRGGAVYAECGGLMYLMNSIEDFEGQKFPMVGVFPYVAKMSRSHMMIGYRHLELIESCMLGPSGLQARGHEFHYSTLVPLDEEFEGEFVCQISDASRSHKGPDGLKFQNTLALYTHLHFGSQAALAKNLVDFSAQTRSGII
ncbi:cobyrinate a,c-diamide synthase [Candidatus Nitronereus thalassa]|uniref:Cobyrinate a,c-diamide synthase n=1 Tax=Candidatus Nitronereus thalassa TaxID=3020898 RepID=A0ABU3K4U3_9BACT|nr:cobyrinate a,c-diamide synthase [Candidatus Nitronereus thalassa]MDT7041417.1 cobyrinate a,c-diamide synthase [Candidatus Nitronereus thalassa]